MQCDRDCTIEKVEERWHAGQNGKGVGVCGEGDRRRGKESMQPDLIVKILCRRWRQLYLTQNEYVIAIEWNIFSFAVVFGRICAVYSVGFSLKVWIQSISLILPVIRFSVVTHWNLHCQSCDISGLKCFL